LENEIQKKRKEAGALAGRRLASGPLAEAALTCLPLSPSLHLHAQR